MLQRLFCCLAVAASIIVATSSASFAGFKVCNRASVGSIDVALGQHRGRNGWESNGWFTLQSGECATLIARALREQYYYLYAVSGETAWDGDNEDSGSTFCIRPGAVFKLNDDSIKKAGEELDCEKHGYVTKTFFKVDTEGATDFTFDLKD